MNISRGGNTVSREESQNVGGYTGKILFVNLSSGEIEEERPDRKTYRGFIGGYGLGAKIIYERQRAGADPLGPESMLGFATGPLTGVVPFAGRYMVVGKSPLTGTWGDANSGGYFGPQLKAAGYDAVFFTGASERPVYLWVKDGRAELRDAGHLWGLDTTETEETIRDELDDHKIRVACIGPAGEKRSLIAAIINDKGRAAARSGLGAVMGAKGLKAVAVRGRQRVPVADREALKAAVRDMTAPLRQEPSRFSQLQMRLMAPLLPWLIPWMVKRGIPLKVEPAMEMRLFRQQGTCAQTALSAESGDSPVKNWGGVGSRDFPMATRSRWISDQAVVQYQTKGYACAGCPLGCGGIVRLEDGHYTVSEGHKPEYETLCAFGTLCLNDDVASIIKANDMCNRHGLDTISAGATIAFAIECYENGLLSLEDTGGIALRWGNAEAIIEMLDKLARREGFGDVLADGVKVAAERIGRGAERYAVHVGGQELPMHDPKYAPSYGTAYVADPTPGRHTAGGYGVAEQMGLADVSLDGLRMPTAEKYQYQGKGEVQAVWSNLIQVLNCAGLCMFSAMYSTMPLAELLGSVTGWEWSIEGLLQAGERIQTLRQAFNVREGFVPADFRLPDRARGEPPFPVGPTAGVTVDVDTMVREYYAAMSWDAVSGRPASERLVALDLVQVAEDLYG
jgi:aldehyde:ferredoxin oxidoreductase